MLRLTRTKEMDVRFLKGFQIGTRFLTSDVRHMAPNTSLALGRRRIIFSAFLFSGILFLLLFSSLFCGPRPSHFPTKNFSWSAFVCPQSPDFPWATTPGWINQGQVWYHLGAQRGRSSLPPSFCSAASSPKMRVPAEEWCYGWFTRET